MKKIKYFYARFSVYDGFRPFGAIIKWKTEPSLRGTLQSGARAQHSDKLLLIYAPWKTVFMKKSWRNGRFSKGNK